MRGTSCAGHLLRAGRCAAAGTQHSTWQAAAVCTRRHVHAGRAHASHLLLRTLCTLRQGQRLQRLRHISRLLQPGGAARGTTPLPARRAACGLRWPYKCCMQGPPSAGTAGWSAWAGTVGRRCPKPTCACITRSSTEPLPGLMQRCRESYSPPCGGGRGGACREGGGEEGYRWGARGPGLGGRALEELGAPGREPEGQAGHGGRRAPATAPLVHGAPAATIAPAFGSPCAGPAG